MSDAPIHRLDELWIDGRCHRVSPAIAGHFKFLSDLNSSFATKIGSQAKHIGAIEAKLDAICNVRWTPELKEAVIWRSKQGSPERASMLTIFDLSDEELDGWIERHDRFGRDGLKSTALQTVGRRG